MILARSIIPPTISFLLGNLTRTSENDGKICAPTFRLHYSRRQTFTHRLRATTTKTTPTTSPTKEKKRESFSQSTGLSFLTVRFVSSNRAIWLLLLLLQSASNWCLFSCPEMMNLTNSHSFSWDKKKSQQKKSKSFFSDI